MIRRGFLTALCAGVLLGATPAISADSPLDAKPSADATWIVLGVQPETTSLTILEPVIKKGWVTGFRTGFLELGALKDSRPTDGYMALKLRPDTVYAIAYVGAMSPCAKVFTFQGGAGKVVYITTLNYSRADSAEGVFVSNLAGMSFSQDLEGARSFLKTHYPGLSDNLEAGQYRMMPNWRSRC